MRRVLGFSGGIDSQACARWLLNRYPAEEVVLINSDAGGNEHPITTEFLQWYSREVHSVVFVTPIVADMGRRGVKHGATKERRNRYSETDPLTFDVLAEIKGLFQSRRMQFCTTHLKLYPQLRWMKENLSGQEIIRYSGVRRNESESRKNAQFEAWDDFYGVPLIQPIADWSKAMCFEYVKSHGEKFNELYTLGFSRVGCAPCVNSNKHDIRNWSLRFPEMIDKVRAWEQRTGLSFFRMPFKDGRVRFVDDVVKWSHTEYGGSQLSLEVLYEPPACDSNYGLCE